MSDLIGIVGAGRMGRGIALSYAFAGIPVFMVDIKERNATGRGELMASVFAELRDDLSFLAEINLMDGGRITQVLDRVAVTHFGEGNKRLKDCRFVFEAVPEVMEVKTSAFSYISKHTDKAAIVASTTSSFLVTELADLISNPSRFLNAHWLNPAHLMPLVEVSKGDQTSHQTVKEIITSLESIGKVPVVCSASAGYIVPRIQALAMNEAARLVEEGVASAEDVDKAVKFGFGLRFAVLGLLEFIDWGGGDILYYGSKYLSKSVGQRFQAPKIVEENMRNKKRGLRDGEGFFDYSDIDIVAYRKRRQKEFAAMLEHHKLLPVFDRCKI